MTLKAPAPGPCSFCNWSPDAAHPNVPGGDWQYVEFVDDVNWLCPACGMPNEKSGAGDDTAPAPTGAPEPVPDPAPSAEANPSPLADGASVESEPHGSPPAEVAPTPDATETLEDPAAETLEALNDLLTLVTAFRDGVIPRLLFSDPDPFTLTDLLAAIHATSIELVGVAQTVALHTQSQLAAVGSPDPETLEGSTHDAEA